MNSNNGHGENREESFGSRILGYMRSTPEHFRLPMLTDYVVEHPDGSETVFQLHTPEDLKENWQRLRDYVVSEPRDDGDSIRDPSRFDPKGIDYLESMVRTLERRIDEVETSIEAKIEGVRHWMKESSESDDENSADESRRKEIVNNLRDEQKALEEKLSWLEFRKSVAEAMLSQMAISDYILTWEEFYDGSEPHRKLSIHEDRAYRIGKALLALESSDSDELEFEDQKEFLEWSEDIVFQSSSTIYTSLENAGCLKTGKQGSSEGLDDTLRRCMEFADQIENFNFNRDEQ